MKEIFLLAVGIAAGIGLKSLQINPESTRTDIGYVYTPQPENVLEKKCKSSLPHEDGGSGSQSLPRFFSRRMRVTAYCPCEKCCGDWADGYTATGYKINLGDKFVAAPPEIPFGTMVDIPGYGLVQVRDRGGAIKGDRLDVYFDTHQAALNWGVQWLDVEILN